jgi:hypothetical protein
MQAAEGSFNTKYPHEPNGIKDPEYFDSSVEFRKLKAALTSAEVESPIDMEHIKLALQGYNYGKRIYLWANQSMAVILMPMQWSFHSAGTKAWLGDSYGDTQYPAHVLRYYPYGRAFTGRR